MCWSASRTATNHPRNTMAAIHPSRRSSCREGRWRQIQWEDIDLIDAMVMAADEACSDEQIARVERCTCPGCGSCSGMFTANSMNCLTEALDSLPGNGTIVATHANRRRLFRRRGADRPQRRTLLFSGRRIGAPAFGRDQSLLRKRHVDRHRWAARPTRCSTCWPAREAGVWISRAGHRPPFAPDSGTLQGGSPTRSITYRTSTAPAASSPFWANWRAPACSTPRSRIDGRTLREQSTPATCAARR